MSFGRGSRVVAIVTLIALGLPAATATLASTPDANLSPNIAGTKCTRVGQVRAVKGTSYVCAKSKARLVWTKQTTGSSGGTAGGTSGGTSCVSSPSFTHNFIDPDHVQFVSPLGGQTAFGGVIAVRSYVHTKPSLHGQRLPLYAPADMDLVQASYYLPAGAPADYKAEYSLFYEFGCSLQLQLYHVKGVVGKTASAVPKVASPSSAGQPVTRAKVAAGEQIGWYEGEAGRSVAFDFRVEDSKKKNSFINQSRFEQSDKATGELYAKCGYDYYVEPLKSVWMAKLGGGEGPVPGTSCGLPSQGIAGTASGMWFLPGAKVNETKYSGASFSDSMVGPAGQYQSQIMLNTDPSGTVRIGGLNVSAPVGQMMIFSNQATWKRPETILAGQSHCWTDSRQSVKIEVMSATSMLAVVGSGSCESLSAASGLRYER